VSQGVEIFPAAGRTVQAHPGVDRVAHRCLAWNRMADSVSSRPRGRSGFLRHSLPIETPDVAQFKSLRAAFLWNKLGDGKVSGAGFVCRFVDGRKHDSRKYLYSLDIFPRGADTPAYYAFCW